MRVAKPEAPINVDVDRGRGRAAPRAGRRDLLRGVQWAFLGLGSNIEDRLDYLQSARRRPGRAPAHPRRRRVQRLRDRAGRGSRAGSVSQHRGRGSRRCSARARCWRRARVEAWRWGASGRALGPAHHRRRHPAVRRRARIRRRKLQVPHPRLTERPFALVPLLEVATGQEAARRSRRSRRRWPRSRRSRASSWSGRRYTCREAAAVKRTAVIGPGRVGTALGMALAPPATRSSRSPAAGQAAVDEFVGARAVRGRAAGRRGRPRPRTSSSSPSRTTSWSSVVRDGCPRRRRRRGQPLDPRLGGARHRGAAAGAPGRRGGCRVPSGADVSRSGRGLGCAARLLVGGHGRRVGPGLGARAGHRPAWQPGHRRRRGPDAVSRRPDRGQQRHGDRGHAGTGPAARRRRRGSRPRSSGPLVTTSAANAAERGAAALTGPVRRGDAGTVAAHLGELRETLPEAVDAYVALSRLALGYARRAGLDADRGGRGRRRAGRADGRSSRDDRRGRGSAAARCRARWGWCPTMGALHAGPPVAGDAPPARDCATVVGEHLRQPAAVRTGRGLRRATRGPRRATWRLLGEPASTSSSPRDAAAFTPPGRLTTVSVAGLTDRLEGASRPGHFDGVDDDRDEAVQHGAARPRVLRREGLPAAGGDPPDGRRPQPAGHGRRLPDRARTAMAWRCPAATSTCPPEQRAGRAGPVRGAARRRRARGTATPMRPCDACAVHCRAASGVRLDYAEVVDPETLEPLEGVVEGPAQALVAAFVGDTRLIDNIRLEPSGLGSTAGGPDTRARPCSAH